MTVIGHGYDDNVGAPAFRNMIINGGMTIDQRNNGGATTGAGAYAVDRFIFYGSGGGAWSNQRVVDAVSKVSNYALKTTVTTPDTSLVTTDNYLYIQRIEGYNVSHLQFGTANAATVTLSFWVKCSVPGTYSVGFNNGAYNRSYVTQYTISSANVWEKKSITLTGDLTGSWNYTTDTGLSINWALGVGPSYSTTANTWQAGTFHSVTGSTNLFATNGATWQITGVQLEAGSVATPFEFEPYETTLRKCQRYYWQSGLEKHFVYCRDTNLWHITAKNPTTMRSVPIATSNFSLVATTNAPTSTGGIAIYSNGWLGASGAPAFAQDGGNVHTFTGYLAGFLGTIGRSGTILTGGTNEYTVFQVNAEL